MNIEGGSSPAERVHRDPIPLRFHHIQKLISISKSRQRFPVKINEACEPISLETLHQFPGASYPDINNRIVANGEMIQENLESMSEDARTYAQDLAGEKGEYLETHLAEYGRALYLLVNGSPERPVRLSFKPDIICNSCQGIGRNQPGNHCLVSQITKDYGSDQTYYQAVARAKLDPQIPEGIRDALVETTDDEGMPSYLTTLGTIRSDALLEAVEFYAGINR